MEREWHVLIDKKRYGPYTFENVKTYVKEGRVRPDTLVWKKGYQQWLPASKAPELRDLFGTPKPVNPKGETQEDLTPVSETKPHPAVAEPPQTAAGEAQQEHAAQAIPEETAAQQQSTPTPQEQADTTPPSSSEKKRSAISRLQKAVTAQAAVELPLPSLLPNETIVKQIQVVNRRFGFLTSGQTRIALTDRRLLFSVSREFELPYWVLLALFPPLLLHYHFRARQNRQSAIPIDRITAVEKIARPSYGILYAAGTAMLYWSLLHPRLFLTANVHWIVAEFVTWLVYAGIACLSLLLMWSNRITALVVWTAGTRYVLESDRLESQGLESDFDALYAAVQDRLNSRGT